MLLQNVPNGLLLSYRSEFQAAVRISRSHKVVGGEREDPHATDIPRDAPEPLHDTLAAYIRRTSYLGS
jgi:hypothetical protein